MFALHGIIIIIALAPDEVVFLVEVVYMLFSFTPPLSSLIDANYCMWAWQEFFLPENLHRMPKVYLHCGLLSAESLFQPLGGSKLIGLFSNYLW